MDKYENFQFNEFHNAYIDADANPAEDFDGERISFPNHFLSGLITDESGKRLLIVRNADRDSARIQRRQRLEQFFFAATLDMETGEKIIYDVSTDVERILDPQKQRDARYLGAMAIKLENDDGHTATLVVESHDITWIENKRKLSFEQLT